MRLKVSDVPEFKDAYQRINDYFSEIVKLADARKELERVKGESPVSQKMFRAN